MRSLSLKIFLSFWLALLLIVVATAGITIFILSERAAQAPRSPREFANEAAVALAQGGRAGLAEWLRARGSRIPDVFILGPDGTELLGRRVPRFLSDDRGGRPVELHGAPGVQYRPPQHLPTLIGPDGAPYRFVLLPRHRSKFGIIDQPPVRWILLSVALIVTGAVSYLLARSITRPIDDLTAATQKLAAGDLAARSSSATRARGDELARLGASFDTMAQRIHELIESRERLLRDISHELRSPLARMRVALGLVRQPGADAERQLARLELEIERLNGLIGQILSVSRLGAAGAELELERVDLGGLIETIVRDATYEAQSADRTVSWEPPARRIEVRGNPHWLGSAIENVVRNAVRHTPAGSAVKLGLVEEPGCALVCVEDEGPGVPADDLEHIFEPFYRSSGSAGSAGVASARDRASGGEGLGLAITERVLRAHGGSVRALNRQSGGLRVELRLPVQ